MSVTVAPIEIVAGLFAVRYPQLTVAVRVVTAFVQIDLPFAVIDTD